ncbi:hypothetical protein JOB18_026404 [Solea senegalensis]|uniref:Uncharacterized protein n=2 Tax=Solea senegalensis TaxID=28829 RepID=A0AAV6PXZ9_SOLSE|nr:hypothetical protein JOB18_026404 [Solea senegalensis]
MHQTHGLCPDSVQPRVSARLPELSWNWATQKSSAAAVSSGLKACDDLINRQRSQTYPGAAMMSTLSSYTPLSKRGNRLCSVEMDGPSLHRQIDSMKMWLESRRKDTSIPLLSRYPVMSSEKDLA